MMVVESFAWFSRPAMATLPVAQWARVRPARHTVFRYVVWRAGGLPPGSGVWCHSGTAPVSRHHHRARIYLHIWMGCALSTSVISTSGPSCPALFLCAPASWTPMLPFHNITEGAITTEQASSVPRLLFGIFYSAHMSRYMPLYSCVYP